MVYLKKFFLPNRINESYMLDDVPKVYTGMYPLGLFSLKEFEKITFSPITIFYGGNGSGKTTLLNIIASKLNASRKSIQNFGDLFERYIDGCDYELQKDDLKEIKIILSDDVFDFLIDTKAINAKVNRRKSDLSEEFLNYKFTAAEDLNMAFDQYEKLKNKVDANRQTMSKYIRSRLRNNTIIQESNGETALDYWQNEITDNSIYLIDEPENSLSAENQIKLKTFIEESARFFNCQFVIASHSPFLLSLEEATIYDLDETPIKIKEWENLPNIRVYYDFFKSKSDLFED